MQKEITNPTNIFNNDGKVFLAGWSKNQSIKNNICQTQAFGKQNTIKTYYINNKEVALFLMTQNYRNKFSVSITIADLLHGGILSDYRIKKSMFIQTEEYADSFNNEINFSDNNIQLQISNTTDGIYLKCDYIDFNNNKNLYFKILLKDLQSDFLSQIAPFEKNRNYYFYKTFAPNYRASGEINLGKMNYLLNDINTFAYYDFIQFSKPLKHNYTKLSCNSLVTGEHFSLCLSSRVGDNRYGNENCFFVANKLYKLSQINVTGNKENLNKPWYFKAGVTAVDIMFKPYTINNVPMSAKLDNAVVTFGKIFGEINYDGFDESIIIDNTNAHLLFCEF